MTTEPFVVRRRRLWNGAELHESAGEFACCVTANCEGMEPRIRLLMGRSAAKRARARFQCSFNGRKPHWRQLRQIGMVAARYIRKNSEFQRVPKLRRRSRSAAGLGCAPILFATMPTPARAPALLKAARNRLIPRPAKSMRGNFASYGLESLCGNWKSSTSAAEAELIMHALRHG